MRLGLVVYGLDRGPTGIGRYMQELVRALAGIQPRPQIYLLGAGGPGPLRGQTPFPWQGLPGCRLLPGLVTVGNAAIARAAGRLGLDLVHDLTGVAPLLGGRGRFRTVATLFDVFPLSFPGHSTTLDSLIHRHWLPRVAPRIDAVITISRHSQADIQKYLPIPAARITSIYPGVSATFRRRPEREVRAFVQQRFALDAPYLLYTGALSARKNVGRLLEAFARLQPAFPALHLVIAGAGGENPARLRAHPRWLQVADRVHCSGALSDAELALLYSGARLFLFPSLYEGFGLPVLEAMACGAPVLTSDRASLPEVAGSAALLVDPLDVAAMVEAVEAVLTRPALATRLREQGLARAAPFTWERTARETLAVYERLLRDE